jgi:dynein heavy chain
MVPDRQLIMENMLMAEGFVEAKMLAKKFASLYYLLEAGVYTRSHFRSTRAYCAPFRSA